MHNGMGGAVEQIDHLFQHSPIVLATTTHACLKKGHGGDFYHTGKGVTHLGGTMKKVISVNFCSPYFNTLLPKLHGATMFAKAYGKS